MKRFLTTVICVLLSTPAFSQQLKLPDDQELAAEAQRQFALSVDNMSIKRHREAANAIHWLLKNVPDLYDGLYVNGYKAYEELAKKEKDEAQKRVYLDSMLLIYDLKEKRYGLNNRELNSKAYKYYRYFRANKGKVEEGLSAYHRAYEDNPQKVINNNLVSYMDMARRYKAYGFEMSDEEVLNIYTKVNEVIDYKESKGGDVDKLNRYREQVNSLLTTTIGPDRLNCEFIETNLAPAMVEKPNDIKLAKKVFQLLLSQKCSDSEYFIKAAELIQKQEPTDGLAKVLAQRYFGMKDYGLAEKFYMEAINLTENMEKKAELYFELAKMYAAQGKKPKSRDTALKAINTNNTVAADAYTHIGNLYMGSFDDCKEEKSRVQDRAIFFAAYDAYQKAGNTKAMATAKAQFPSAAEIFELTLKEGDPIKVNCWINVTSTIRKRPSE